jgi:hypothetical protein
VAVCAAALIAASAAGAATPAEIYADLAAHGKLTKAYSAADLRAASLDAGVQGYGGPAEQTMRPVVVQAAAAATKTAAQTYRCVGLDRNGNRIMAPANGSSSAPVAACVKGAQFTKTNTAPAATLPFTGLQLGVFAAVGLALLGGGLLLRRAARD